MNKFKRSEIGLYRLEFRAQRKGGQWTESAHRPNPLTLNRVESFMHRNRIEPVRIDYRYVPVKQDEQA